MIQGRRLFLWLIPALWPGLMASQELAAYRLFGADGQPATPAAVVTAAAQADVFFFGEQHDNALAHWLRWELCQQLHQQRPRQLMLGAEMFEADNQVLIDEYWRGQITKKSFEDEARLWANYATDYAPLLEWAKAQGIPLVATNIPRRYANLVFRQGLAALPPLSPAAQAWMAPLPIAFDPQLPGYQAMVKMMGGHGGESTEKLVQAQAVKDATMAHFIAQNWRKGQLLVHLNGAYHSDRQEGIVWYLRRLNPKLRVVTLSTVTQDDLSKLAPENGGLADFILVTPNNMTKTH